MRSRLVRGDATAAKFGTSAVVVGQAEEATYLGDGRRREPLVDNANFGGVGRNPLGGQKVPEVDDGGLVEDALVHIGVELMLAEAIEHPADMFAVLIGRIGENEDVVEIHRAEPVEAIAKYIVHQALEGTRRVTQAERKYVPFKGPVLGVKGGLGPVRGMDLNLPVSGLEVDDGVVRFATHPIEYIRRHRQRIAIAHGDAVQGAVVHAQPHRTILLFHEDHGCTERGYGRGDGANLGEESQLFAQLILLGCGETKRRAVGWASTGQ